MTDVFDVTIAKASPGQRAGAYIIDAIPAVLVGLLVGWVPVVGAMIAGLVLGPYWLLRDVTGASIGKLLLGLRVASADGGNASVAARVARNVPLSLGSFLLILPVIGYAIAPVVAICLGLVEVILVASQNDRMGDKLAHTTVVAKSR